MTNSAANYLRRNIPKDDVEKTAALLVEDDAVLRETRSYIDEKLLKSTEIKAIDRGGRVTKIRQKRAGRWPKYEVYGEDGSWWELDDPIWAFAMAKLYLQKKGLNVA